MAFLDSADALASMLQTAFRDCDDTGNCRAVLRQSGEGHHHAPGGARGVSFSHSPEMSSRFMDASNAQRGSVSAVPGADGTRSKKKVIRGPVDAAATVYANLAPIGWMASREKGGLGDGSSFPTGKGHRSGSDAGGNDAVGLPFPRREIAPDLPAVSAMTRLREQLVNNPFSHYSQFAAGHDGAGAINIKIWFPFIPDAQPLDISVVAHATVLETIGYTMFEYTEDRSRTQRLAASVDAYVLRMEEGDGEPDMDLPALAGRQKISRFGFDSLCLCVNTAHALQLDKPVGATPARRFVQVYYSDSGATILKRESNEMTVLDVLEHTLRKRCLRFGPEYVLEPKYEPGHVLDPNMLLSDYEGGDTMKALEFQLIRKHSKRRDLAVESETSAAAGNELLDSLAVHQPKAYYVARLAKFSSHQVELLVYPDKMSVSQSRRTSLLSSKQKPLSVPLDDVLRIYLIETDRKAGSFRGGH